MQHRDLFVLGPQQHVMTDLHSPSVAVTLVINGNLPVPSSWSRRRTPTQALTANRFESTSPDTDGGQSRGGLAD